MFSFRCWTVEKDVSAVSYMLSTILALARSASWNDSIVAVEADSEVFPVYNDVSSLNCLLADFSIQTL